MARVKGSQALVATTWTKVFDSTPSGGADGEPCRGFAVVNPAASVADIRVFVVPLHSGADGQPGGTDGVPVIPGSSREFLGVSPGGQGTIRQVWLYSTGTPNAGYGVTA